MSSEQALVFGCLPCCRPHRRPGLSDTPVLAQKLARPARSPSSDSRSTTHSSEPPCLNFFTFAGSADALLSCVSRGRINV
jgi:hypothetical protein